MALTPEQVREALKQVKFPGLARDIVSFGFVKEISVAGGEVQVAISFASANPEAGPRIEAEATRVVQALPGVTKVRVHMHVQAPQEAMPQRRLLGGVKFKVAVASGKGGVGKSTVAANMALAMAQQGMSMGLLDADIYGPSQQMMMGTSEPPRVTEEGRVVPVEVAGIRVMSLGFLMDPDTPVIWRGPMVMKAIQQFLEDVEWGQLDCLVVDLPPGTGDAQLTLTQQVPLDGAVIVTTPQDVALIDARKGLNMFRKVNVPVLGVVENMSAFVCPACGHITEIFKKDGGRRTAQQLGVPFLGAVPIDPEIVVASDAGVPIVLSRPDSPAASAFQEIARSVVRQLQPDRAR